MTQDEIIEMAKQAGIIHPEMVDKHLEHFANLVAAKAPPQRTWVGLTLDEIALLHANYPNPQGFALALQDKLKEKNGYAEDKNT